MIKKLKLMMSRALSPDDYTVLANFYMPLISKEAFCLYHHLAHLVSKDDLYFKTHTDKLVIALGIDYMSIHKLREELEGIALLNSYQSDDTLLIHINNPLSANMILKDSCLFAFLKQKMGDDYLKEMADRFKIANLNAKIKTGDYQEITKSFNEVFKSKSDINYYNEDYRKDNLNSKIRLNHQFDFDLFKRLVNPIFYDKNLFSNNYFKEFIMENSYLYGMDEDGIKNAYTKTFSGDVNIDYQLFLKNIKDQYYFQKQTNEVFFVKNDSTNDNSKYNFYYQNFKDFLAEITKMDAITYDIDNLSKLKNMSDLPYEVINYVFEYCYKKNQKKPGFNFLSSVVQTIKMNGLSKIDEVAAFLKNQDFNYQKSKGSNDKIYQENDHVNEEFKDNKVIDLNEYFSEDKNE